MIHDPFSLLPSEARQRQAMHHREVLFRQGETTKGMYRVVSGSVTLQRTSLIGDTLNLHRAKGGGTFAEASIFSAEYHCDAICTNVGIFEVISKTAVLMALRTNPDFAESFTRMLATLVQHQRSLMEIMAIKSATDRVYAAIQAGYLVGTISEFASRINLTHEASYRALRTLTQKGLINQIARGQYQMPQDRRSSA